MLYPSCLNLNVKEMPRRRRPIAGGTRSDLHSVDMEVDEPAVEPPPDDLFVAQDLATAGTRGVSILDESSSDGNDSSGGGDVGVRSKVTVAVQNERRFKESVTTCIEVLRKQANDLHQNPALNLAMKVAGYSNMSVERLIGSRFDAERVRDQIVDRIQTADPSPAALKSMAWVELERAVHTLWDTMKMFGDGVLTKMTKKEFPGVEISFNCDVYVLQGVQLTQIMKSRFSLNSERPVSIPLFSARAGKEVSTFSQTGMGEAAFASVLHHMCESVDNINEEVTEVKRAYIALGNEYTANLNRSRGKKRRRGKAVEQPRVRRGSPLRVRRVSSSEEEGGGGDNDSTGTDIDPRGRIRITGTKSAAPFHLLYAGAPPAAGVPDNEMEDLLLLHLVYGSIDAEPELKAIFGRYIRRLRAEMRPGGTSTNTTSEVRGWGMNAILRIADGAGASPVANLTIDIAKIAHVLFVSRESHDGMIEANHVQKRRFLEDLILRGSFQVDMGMNMTEMYYGHVTELCMVIRDAVRKNPDATDFMSSDERLMMAVYVSEDTIRTLVGRFISSRIQLTKVLAPTRYYLNGQYGRISKECQVLLRQIKRVVAVQKVMSVGDAGSRPVWYFKFGDVLPPSAALWDGGWGPSVVNPEPVGQRLLLGGRPPSRVTHG